MQSLYPHVMPEVKRNIVESAREGDPHALQILMNWHLEPKGITATVELKDGCLRVHLESAQPLERQSAVEFVLNGLTKLQISCIKKIQVYGRKSERKAADWIEVYELDGLNGKMTKPEIKTSPIRRLRVSSKKRKHVLLKRLLKNKKSQMILAAIVGALMLLVAYMKLSS